MSKWKAYPVVYRFENVSILHSYFEIESPCLDMSVSKHVCKVNYLLFNNQVHVGSLSKIPIDYPQRSLYMPKLIKRISISDKK